MFIPDILSSDLLLLPYCSGNARYHTFSVNLHCQNSLFYLFNVDSLKEAGFVSSYFCKTKVVI